MRISNFCRWCLLGVVPAVCAVGKAEPPEVEVVNPSSDPDTGAFSRMLREDQFVGPGVLKVARQSNDEAADPKAQAVLPADFERCDRLVIVADKLAAQFPETFAGLVKATPPDVGLLGIFSDAPGWNVARRVLAEHKLPLDRIRSARVPTDTIWVRDFGPVVVRRVDGRLLALDCQYRRRSGAKQRDRDNAAASAIAGHLGIPIRKCPLELEAGNLLSNGRGLLVTTTVALNANVSRGHNARAITDYLGRTFGCRQIVVLEPLYGEPTGHVDLFACFTSPDTLVLGKYAESVDPLNSAILQRNAKVLAEVRTSKGPLSVVRMAMPDNSDNVWRSYTNSVFAGGLLLVPTYGGAHVQADTHAVSTFRRLLPNWRVLGVDCGKLVRRDGALRCITLSVPAKRPDDK